MKCLYIVSVTAILVLYVRSAAVPSGEVPLSIAVEGLSLTSDPMPEHDVDGITLDYLSRVYKGSVTEDTEPPAAVWEALSATSQARSIQDKLGDIPTFTTTSDFKRFVVRALLRPLVVSDFYRMLTSYFEYHGVSPLGNIYTNSTQLPAGETFHAYQEWRWFPRPVEVNQPEYLKVVQDDDNSAVYRPLLAPNFRLSERATQFLKDARPFLQAIHAKARRAIVPVGHSSDGPRLADNLLAAAVSRGQYELLASICNDRNAFRGIGEDLRRLVPSEHLVLFPVVYMLDEATHYRPGDFNIPDIAMDSLKEAFAMTEVQAVQWTTTLMEDSLVFSIHWAVVTAVVAREDVMTLKHFHDRTIKPSVADSEYSHTWPQLIPILADAGRAQNYRILKDILCDASIDELTQVEQLLTQQDFVSGARTVVELYREVCPRKPVSGLADSLADDSAHHVPYPQQDDYRNDNLIYFYGHRAELSVVNYIIN